jgi:hypothetical protein
MLTQYPHIKGLSEKKTRFIPGFIKTLQQHYIYPKSVKSKVIEQNTGLKGTDVRHIVRYLRREGHWITSTASGYAYLEKTPDNAVIYEECCLRHLEERIASMQKTASEIRHSIDGVYSQTQFDMFREQ